MSQQTATFAGNLKVALIEYARGRRLIWDRKIACTRQERENAWLTFADGFNLPVVDVRKRWEGMRRTYFHELKEFLKTGKKSDWIYFKKLDSFLRDPVEALIRKEPSICDVIDISSGEECEPVATCSYGSAKVPPVNEIKSEVDSSLDNTTVSALPVVNDIPVKLEETVHPDSLNRPGPVITTHAFPSDYIKPKQEDMKHNENEAPVLNHSIEVAQDNNDSTEVMRLETTEDIRNELRKIPPIMNSSLLTPRTPLKPKTRISRVTTSSKEMLPKPKNKPLVGVVANNNIDQPPLKLKIRIGADCKDLYPLGSKFNSSTSKVCRAVPKPKAGPPLKKFRPSMGCSSSISKPSKKSSVQRENSSTLNGNAANHDDPPTSSIIPICEDISEYATLHPSEMNELVGEAENPVVESTSSKGGPEWFQSKMREWRDESEKIGETDEKSPEGDLQSVKKARQQFLLSFLPDMAEMNAEQRKFFKSKLMYLICNNN